MKTSAQPVEVRMQDQLAKIIEHFDAAQKRVDRLANATTERRWVLRRDPKRWSVAECIAHLNLTARAYLPLLRAALEQHPPHLSSSVRYRRDPVGWAIGMASGPLPGIGSFRFGRIRTAAAFVPTGDLCRERTLAEFNMLEGEQIALTKAAEGRPLNDIRIVSPFDRRIGYNAYSCLVLLPRHQLRHIWQAEHVWLGAPAT